MVGEGLRAWIGSRLAALRGRRSEPERTVQDALRLVRRLVRAGIEVPATIVTAVLTARQELTANKGVLTPATGPNLYAAYRQLVGLAAQLEDELGTTGDHPYARALFNSELLLKFAAESGTDVPGPVRADLIAAQTAGAPPPNADIKARFYGAYAVLARLLGSVTADTIKACRAPRTRRALQRDESRALTWAILTVCISVLLFTAEHINSQLKDELTEGNELAIKLKGTIGDVPAGFTSRPCEALDTPSDPKEFQPKQAELDQIQSFAITLRGARSRANKLNGFIAFTECDPFGSCWIRSEADEIETKTALTPDKVPLRDRFELRPTLRNFTAEFLCKVQTWQGVRDYALNVQKSYAATIGGLVAQGLPILYALLGAYAYRLRQFSETVRNRTYHPSFADSARLITAIIAGAVAGLFNPVRDMAVSPLAVAFLVGYGVELFFRFLDTIVNSFGIAVPRTAGTPPVPTASPTPIPSGASTIAPTPTPTPTIAPSPALSPAPRVSPSPAATPKPTPGADRP